MNPGGGHRGQELDEGWCCLDPCGGITGASVAAVACQAVAAGLPSLQVMVIDHLGQALVPNGCIIQPLECQGL